MMSSNLRELLGVENTMDETDTSDTGLNLRTSSISFQVPEELTGGMLDAISIRLFTLDADKQRERALKLDNLISSVICQIMKEYEQGVISNIGAIDRLEWLKETLEAAYMKLERMKHSPEAKEQEAELYRVEYPE